MAKSPYDSLVEQLLLPSNIYEVLDPPFRELGYPLQKASRDDPKLTTLEYWAAQSKDQQIVLLHVPGDIISDPANWSAVSSVAYVFVGKTAGVFFFATIKDLNRDYNTLFGPTLEREFPATKRVRFFDQIDLDNLVAKAPPQRKKLVNYLLDVDKILPPPNGQPPPPAPPDLLTIQDKIADFVFDYYSTQGAVDSKQIFLQLRLSLKWPPDWIWEPQGNPKSDATSLVSYLIKQRDYPPVSNLTGYTTVGVLLEHLMPQVGGETAKQMYNLIVQYRLIEKQEILEELRVKFYGAGG